MFDVVVVGAGPAGSTTAGLLASRGQRVLLLDRARFPRRKPCAEYISPGGVAILERLGVQLDGRRLRGMQIRAPGGECHLVTYHDTVGRTRHGLSMARERLDAALVDVARARGVEVREECRAVGPLVEDGRVRGVRLLDGREIRAHVVVGADGLHSVIARAVARPRTRRWPRRLGLVQHLGGVEWPEDVGQMHVGRHGYVGVAPLDADGTVTVGLVRPLAVRRRRSRAVRAQQPDLQTALCEYPELARRLRGALPCGPVQGVGPLARRPRFVAGPGYLLVGDAAGFFDPFTGEGIFRALRGAELAAELLDAPSAYAAARRAHFGAKERLTAVVQVFVQTPRLMDLAVARLNQRPQVARQLGNMLGDLEPARLGIIWSLLGP